MEEGTIIKWLRAEGDEVSRGDEIVEIETDKANMVYEADSGGILQIVAQEGDTLPVGGTIARIGDGSEAPAVSAGAAPEAAHEPAADAAALTVPEAESQPEAPAGQSTALAPGAAADIAAGTDDAAVAAVAADIDGAGAADVGGAGLSDGLAAVDTAAASAAGNGRLKASPVARRMATDLGIELSSLTGTGPGGRIVKADVEAAASGATGQAADGVAASSAAALGAGPASAAAAGVPDAYAPAGVGATPGAAATDSAVTPATAGAPTQGKGVTTVEELSRLQQTIARRMAESKATAPEFVVTAEVDMEDAVAFRTQLKAASGEDPAPSYNDFIIKAAALALREFPRANGAYRDGRFELYSRINVGIAVAAQDALIVPTIFDADSKSLGEISRDARSLAGKVRDGKITPPDLASGTFSVSNLGMFGIKRFSAVLNPPQAAILAVGELTPRPVVRAEKIVVRTVLELTLTCDHRILYGADAAQFLGKIRERLENPLSLAL